LLSPGAPSLFKITPPLAGGWPQVALSEKATRALESVADVCRRNIHRAPTQAVARTFGVKPRMASTYVDRARQANYLPPTKQGKKKA
jgi:hypothetical protein